MLVSQIEQNNEPSGAPAFFSLGFLIPCVMCLAPHYPATHTPAMMDYIVKP